MSDYYTVSSANALIPTISKLYERVLECRSSIMRSEQLLQAAASSDMRLDDYVKRKQALNDSLCDFYLAMRDLEKTGVVIKGIDDGLLDFPARRFDDDVWLCWKYGETEIKFWHEKDSGFSKRKPLAVDDATLT